MMTGTTESRTINANNAGTRDVYLDVIAVNKIGNLKLLSQAVRLAFSFGSCSSVTKLAGCLIQLINIKSL
ncbi:hypothetical protein, partial [Neobacillus vireti]|uniref:hypothetical protein n=1 Tax=Neobacillus vireti TaxID=220686 RepID=UPI002FFFF932